MAEEQREPQETASYDAEQIKVLEGLEAVRRRPAMYIGSTGVEDPPALRHRRVLSGAMGVLSVAA